MVTIKKKPKLVWFNGNDLLGDSCIMQEILSQIEYYSGTERKKMLKVSPKIGGSMLYGLTWRAYLKKDKVTGEIITRKKDPVSGLYFTKVMETYPQLKEIFAEFADQYFPEFHYTQVQLNKNFPCPPHKDAANQGDSILISFGDYTGGKTAVDLGNEVYIADSHYKPFKFNGSKFKHWVEYTEGERYSLVFFSRFKKLII